VKRRVLRSLGKVNRVFRWIKSGRGTNTGQKEGARGGFVDLSPPERTTLWTREEWCPGHWKKRGRDKGEGGVKRSEYKKNYYILLILMGYTICKRGKAGIEGGKRNL